MTSILSFVLATSILALSPGPDNIYVLVQSISNGKSSGLATVLGLISGCIVHTTLLAFGISAVVKTNENLFFVLKVFGALYLLFLAYKTFNSKEQMFYNSKVNKDGLIKLFKRGFMMNVLNPKVMVFFLAFFPGFLFSETLNIVVQFYILGGIFMLTSSFIFFGIVLLSTHIKPFLVKYTKIQMVFKWLQIFVFIGIAVYILKS